MPRKHRRRKSRQADYQLDGNARFALMGGNTYFPGEPTSDPDVQRQLWSQHRDELMAEWIAEHPGTRPAGWWRWEAPEEHRVPWSRGFLRPSREYQIGILRRHHLLTAAEQVVLEAE